VNPYLYAMTKTQYLDRTLHLVDIENLSGGCDCSIEGVSETACEYLSLFPSTEKDLYVLATSVHNALPCGFGWPTSTQRLMRSGENGADLELIEAYEPQWIALRFRRIVIGSGDGIFTELANELTALGCHVTVVTRPEALSKRLSLAVNAVVFLSSTTDEMEAVCAA
jgi:hypothetical protein